VTYGFYFDFHKVVLIEICMIKSTATSYPIEKLECCHLLYNRRTGYHMYFLTVDSNNHFAIAVTNDKVAPSGKRQTT